MPQSIFQQYQPHMLRFQSVLLRSCYPVTLIALSTYGNELYLHCGTPSWIDNYVNHISYSDIYAQKGTSSASNVYPQASSECTHLASFQQSHELLTHCHLNESDLRLSASAGPDVSRKVWCQWYGAWVQSNVWLLGIRRHRRSLNRKRHCFRMKTVQSVREH